ncbi:MAG: PAS domain S-box protein, partial [Acetobacteraceae bacterium]|nr:PAS domain S-box protein [Acetobacteraceae bacterium]
ARIFAEANSREAAFRLEYRLRRHDGAWRWAIDAAAPRRGPGGEFLGYIGSVIDITERREAEERQTLMARELDHRAKNALAVVQAAVRLTPKGNAAAYAAAIEGRVAALARAHSVLAEGSWQGASLRAVIEAELATFLATAPDAGTPRAMVEGPRVLLAPAAVQGLSMALHELATNATKYGALSEPEGRLAVTWSLDEPARRLRLRWEERCGPAVAAAPARHGFGARVIEATMTGQLGGQVEREWRQEGLVCRIDLPLDRVVAQPGAGMGAFTAPAALAAAEPVPALSDG